MFSHSFFHEDVALSRTPHKVDFMLHKGKADYCLTSKYYDDHSQRAAVLSPLTTSHNVLATAKYKLTSQEEPKIYEWLKAE